MIPQPADPALFLHSWWVGKRSDGLGVRAPALFPVPPAEVQNAKQHLTWKDPWLERDNYKAIRMLTKY